jgi:hypothetical protein
MKPIHEKQAAMLMQVLTNEDLMNRIYDKYAWPSVYDLKRFIRTTIKEGYNETLNTADSGRWCLNEIRDEYLKYKKESDIDPTTMNQRIYATHSFDSMGTYSTTGNLTAYGTFTHPTTDFTDDLLDELDELITF